MSISSWRPLAPNQVGSQPGSTGSGATEFVSLLSSVRGAVDAGLEDIWKEVEAEHAGRGEAVAKPLGAARELCLRGGKRLRAALVATGYCIGTGQREWAPVLEACCAVELLQAYFLIHDDWMDQDRLRRGGATVHAALEAHFPSVHAAASGAVLAGDFTLALALRVLSRTRLAPERWPLLLERFARMQLDAVVGQQLDVLGPGRDLEEVYRLKTASYTVLGPLALGFVASAGPPQTAQVLEAFATPLGVAFQLQDDLIGAFASPAVSGKPRGSDLRAGKRTALVEVALSEGDAAAQRALGDALGHADVAPEVLSAALDALERCGARRAVERRIDALARQARTALERGPLATGARALLEGVLEALLEREH